MRKTAARHDPRSPRIGFDKWGLDASKELKTVLKRLLKEGMEIASRRQCNAWFPADGTNGEDGVGGPAPKDPTVIYVELPVGEFMDDCPRWSFSLSALVDNAISLHEMGEGGPLAGEARHSLEAIRNGLKQLVDKFEEALGRRET